MGSLNLKKILAIVEGQKSDYRLMNHLLKMFYKDEFYVWPYCTNLYELYNTFQLCDREDFESVDTLLAIKAREHDPDKLVRLNEKYTDIILIFDLDPQDPQYSPQKIQKMKNIFNESTDNGKLYINYPMVEAFKHLKAEVDKEYIHRMVSIDDLVNKRYKSIVDRDTYQSNFEMYGKLQCLQNMKQNLQKTNFIINGVYELPNDVNDYEIIDFSILVNIQVKLLAAESQFYVLCTCILFLLDYSPSYFLKQLHELY